MNEIKCLCGNEKVYSETFGGFMCIRCDKLNVSHLWCEVEHNG